MFIVYVLKNNVSGRHYVGSTNNIERRLLEHNRGQTRSTNQIGCWSIVYQEEYRSAIEAKRRERQVKSYKGGQAFKKMMER